MTLENILLKQCNKTTHFSIKQNTYHFSSLCIDIKGYASYNF